LRHVINRSAASVFRGNLTIATWVGKPLSQRHGDASRPNGRLH
jgi:hypothetical protein